jgi:hypothetical protein
VRVLLTIAVATLCFAATQTRVSTASILAVERTINERLAGSTADPYEIIVDSRGTYLEGYGAVFTNEINLVNSAAFNPYPFRPTVSPQQIAQVHERKVKKLAELKDTMRTLLMDASNTLESMPANEKVAIEAKLFSFSWEDGKGIPHRLLMSAAKQKLVAARSSHASKADLAAIIDEQER